MKEGTDPDKVQVLEEGLNMRDFEEHTGGKKPIMGKKYERIFIKTDNG